VDLLLEPDFPEIIDLLEPWPEIHRIYHQPSAWAKGGESSMEGFGAHSYAVAVFTHWARHWEPRVQAGRKIVFDESQWNREGDVSCTETSARELGWDAALPRLLAADSGRRFDLPPETVALHPGCKPNWSWKKWHGFAEIAKAWSSVVIVGTPGDLDNHETYFRHDFIWPDHVVDYTGKLNLADTAALIRQSKLLVSNDSGLMHLAVALGVPTHAIFGITSPAREGPRAANFFPITKGLDCEPEYRRQPWGRCNCHRNLECLRTLEPVEVVSRVQGKWQAPGPRAATEAVRIAYHGYVFDASGFGSAARAYIRALHRAGVELTVSDMGMEKAVQDPLIVSLLDRPLSSPDFHLFHGVPSDFAQSSLLLDRVIAMSVWETDTMPPEWKETLDTAVDVWLPSRFNTSVFSRALTTRVFRLPHALDPCPPDPTWNLPCEPGDFVFYSIIEWQERKSVPETILCYLEAFRDRRDTVLLIKMAPRSAGEANQALEQARSHTGSRARVEIIAERWTAAQIAALHCRGNCYISLHRGEGWGYPLFDAAAQGVSIVATAFSGPLDFLDPKAHRLVPAEPTPVWQPYRHYSPAMRWSEPVWPVAIQSLRDAYASHRELTELRTEAAKRIRAQFSLEAIGDCALARLRALRQLQG
jgi:hypothetical protein